MTMGRWAAGSTHAAPMSLATLESSMAKALTQTSDAHV